MEGKPPKLKDHEIPLNFGDYIKEKEGLTSEQRTTLRNILSRLLLERMGGVAILQTLDTVIETMLEQNKAGIKPEPSFEVGSREGIRYDINSVVDEEARKEREAEVDKFTSKMIN